MTRTGDVELITVLDAVGVKVEFSLLEETAAPLWL